MRHQRFITAAALVAVLAAAGFTTADDRNFMTQAAAPPNLIFILDTSSSMVGSPEVAPLALPVEDCDPAELVIDTDGDTIPDTADPQRCLTGLLVPLTNVPGAGDDPYSRMGIAKRVLKDFLDDVGIANVVLAGYAQAEPADSSNGVPLKHWVYEARAQDRFHMLEASYAYRFGYAENHAGILLDNPGEIYPEAMIGYKLYFDPASTDLNDRFGPTNAYDTGYLETLPDTSTLRLPYDLMPVYFGNCFMDDGGTPADESDDVPRCWDSTGEPDTTMVFPFYGSGSYDAGDGHMLSERWYYGDPGSLTFPNCEPSITPTADNPDNGCLAEWEETVGASILQHKRRVHLEIPETVGGQPNHFLAVDSGGNRVGNTVVPDTPGNENYDGLAGAEADYDGDENNDWVMYVASVEQRNYKTCAPPSGLPSWTPTPTKTAEEYCKIEIVTFDSELSSSYPYAMYADVTNQSGYTAELVGTWWDWGQGHSATDYIQYLCFGGLQSYGSPLAVCTSSASSYQYWDDETGTSGGADGKYARPLDDAKPFQCTAGDCDVVSNSLTNTSTRRWIGVLNSSATVHNGIYQVCFDFNLVGAAPDGGDYLCPDICAVTTGGSFATPTNTPLATSTATRTPTPGGPTSTPTATTPSGGSTPTRTPTAGFAATSTPTPSKTPTPRPPTPTQTPSRTATPVG
jgi:hypothetical protein